MLPILRQCSPYLTGFEVEPQLVSKFTRIPIECFKRPLSDVCYNKISHGKFRNMLFMYEEYFSAGEAGGQKHFFLDVFKELLSKIVSHN